MGREKFPLLDVLGNEATRSIRVASPVSGECIPWWGYIRRDGYGQMGRNTLAHRGVWVECFGSIPDGLTLDHLCRNTSCVNPEHLQPVTIQENIRRAARTHCPQGHPYDKANTARRPSTGYRECRECNRVKHRKGGVSYRSGTQTRARWRAWPG